jgi:hypothetical protein
MSVIYPNIVPDNNLRLPDALTVKHGPAPLLARFVLEGDKAAREQGIRLRLRHDFAELAFLNAQHIATGSWYPLFDMVHPELVDLNPDNAFWVSGENDAGDIVTTWAGRIYYWPNTNLAERADEMGYDGRRCIITAPAARLITGVAICGSASWVRPDYRGRYLSQLIPRVAKAYAFARWPIDWSFCFIAEANLKKGLAVSYGQQHLSFKISYPGSHFGEIALAYTAADETYQEFAAFLEAKLSGPEYGNSETPDMSTGLEHMVTNTSSDGVFQGSNSRS